MKLISSVRRPLLLLLLLLLSLATFATSTLAQTVTIPDPGLNAAVREALQKPNGPLTQPDMLGLTNLVAIFRNISTLQGLETAHNLRELQLDDNHITDASFPGTLTNMPSLDTLVLNGNPLTNLTLPAGLTNLRVLRVEDSTLTNLSLPAGLTKFTELRLGFNHLVNLSLPADLTNLSILSAFQNQLTNLTLPLVVTNLGELNLSGNQFSQLPLPAGLFRLGTLILSGNKLTSFTVPADMTNLLFLRLDDNKLSTLALPARMTNLAGLFLGSNQLTNLALPSDLNHLTQMELMGNQLVSLSLPPGLTSLAFLNLNNNQLTNITLPPDMQQLIGLFVAGNPLTTFVLSELLAATGLASVVDSLQNQGVNVFTYPLAAQLVRPARLEGAFKIGIAGPPGVYTLLGSTNLVDWTVTGVVSNPLGHVNFVSPTAQFPQRRFYRALLFNPPADLVFVPPNTFMMGSPTNEQDRNIFEGPQSAVTLTRGFWIGKYDVTQGEYLNVTGTNPSDFPGDLTRAISSVTWFDATNYCWLLTQKELAAGHIPAGSRYRLPTEAEWECAARAGTTNRFSYGDDPSYSSLTNYAWFLDLGHPDLTVHPVGQKLPNPWGLYDVHGQVWEWCQDWYGDQTGGSKTDPQGPASNVQGLKVMRGGAYDYPDSSCRSASRFFRFADWPDSDVGFRVVLVIEPQ